MRNDRLHLTVEDWSRKYGRAFRFRIGTRTFLVLAGAEAIAAVLRDRPEGFARTSRLSAIADEMGFNGVFSANGEPWRRQRAMVMASFDPAHTKAYFPSLVRVTRRFAGRLRRAAEAGRAIDLQADLMRYTVDVTAGLAFGVDINTLESEEEVIQAHLDKIFPALFSRLMAPIPYWRYFKLPADRALGRHLQALHQAVDGFIGLARRRLAQDGVPRNLIEAMIAARDAHGSELSDADVAGNVLTMLLAGEDTTANTLAWMLWLLWRHPEALARARDEVRREAGPFPERYEQVQKLAYVEACANETMRLKPVAPLIILEALRDTTVDGVAMKRGQLVMCLMRPPATDAKNFSEPERFLPERWLGANPAAAKRAAMPFGAGPRLCPGRYLAMLEIKMAMAMLLGGFEIADLAAPGGEPQEHLAFTMTPTALRMRLHPMVA